ncbi:hypothetical protein EB796_011144 [Bugula neritina]|uniref:Uncharacterized protein n=1 Tax=Bugula neritina TaxID=10212 RepID=A0A7J7JXA2_BUGNE|nr:hypothetical protein EB796_011144 [Bugula neritina]
MIWEQNVTMIVMLTQLIERGRKQCEQYWPETVEKPATYGDLVVTKRAESVLPEYTIRILDIQMGKTIRTIKHILSTFWPSSGCPSKPQALLEFVLAVRSQMLDGNSSPILVHCSAGVGRTGTYIAVDRLLQCIQDHDEIDIFNLVMEIREYRCRMVQTEEQYRYIHDCVKEVMENGFPTVADHLYEQIPDIIPSLVYETPHGSTSQQKDERFTASGSSLPENEPEYDDQLMDSNSLDGGPSSLPAEYMGPDLVDLLAEYEQPFRADPPLDLKQSLPVDKQPAVGEFKPVDQAFLYEGPDEITLTSAGDGQGERTSTHLYENDETK